MPQPKSTKSPTVTPANSVAENYVYIEKSMTKNMGDYNSAKITIGLTVRVNPTREELKAIRATVEIVDKVVDSEMHEQLKELER